VNGLITDTATALTDAHFHSLLFRFHGFSSFLAYFFNCSLGWKST